MTGESGDDERDQSELERLRVWFNELEPVRYFHMCCEDLASGVAHVSMQPPPMLMAPSGALNGGFLASLAEHTAGLAALAVYPADSYAGAVQFEMQMLEPIYAMPAVAEARMLRTGSRLAFARVDIHDGERRLCARGSCVYAVTSSVTWMGR
jgi:uncharacterized protein (TIGR00369 family)